MSSTRGVNKVAAGLLIPHDLVVPFAETLDIQRGPHRPETVPAVIEAWRRQPGTAPRRDYIAIDESGDFDGNAGGVNDTFLVGAAVHFDVGAYPRLAGMFAPWRYIVHEGHEVKAASGRLGPDEEDMFLDQVMAAAGSGVCAVSIGIIEKVSHRQGAFMTDLREKPDLRRAFHLDLLRIHLSDLRPRTQQVRVLIDQCGLDPVQEREYQRMVGKLLPDLNLGGVHARVDFLDSLTVETIQLADLLAGTIRKMFRGSELPDLLRLSRRFLVSDLTDRG